MQQVDLSRFVAVLHELERAERAASRRVGTVAERTDHLREALVALSTECLALALSAKLYRDIHRLSGELDLSSTQSTASALAAAEGVRSRLVPELAAHQFRRLDTDAVGLLGTDLMRSFGPIASRLPSLAHLVEAAGCCIAYELPTCAVHYLLCAFELGLESMLDALMQPPDRHDREGALEHAEAVVAKLGSGAARERYSRAIEAFPHLRVVWRYHATRSHIAWQRETALMALEHVRAFLLCLT